MKLEEERRLYQTKLQADQDSAERSKNAQLDLDEAQRKAAQALQALTLT